jgi:hypothetical protein
VKENEKDISASQQEQEKNTWFSGEDEDCFGKRSNQEKARKR